MAALYMMFGGLELTGEGVPALVPSPGGGADPTVRTSGLIWTGLLVLACAIGLGIVIKRLNSFMRKVIGKVAAFINTDIFMTELALTGLIWVSASVILLLVLPVGVFLTVTCFVLNEACFVMAWAGYGRKKYTL